jgi:hypothetical protein
MNRLKRVRQGRRPRDRKHAVELGVERFEDRFLLSTFTVTSTADSAPANNPTSGTLRWAVEQADATTGSNTINFNLGSSPQVIALTAGQLELNMQNASTSITIDGPGANLLSISGNNASRVFAVYYGTASISGVTITGGAVDRGAGVRDIGSTVSLTDCTVSGNSASVNGGGIYNQNGGQLTLTDCTVSGNTTAGGGAGLYTVVRGSTTTLTDCTVSSNSAGGSGGGLSSDATTMLTNCTVSDNSAPTEGGGIANVGGTTTLTNCTVYGNSTGDNGGGIANDSATTTLTNCTVSGNSASQGGGLWSDATATLGNTIVALNTAASGPDVSVSSSGNITSKGNNLIGKTDGSSGWGSSDLTGTIAHPLNPLLGPLGNDGGPTETMALLSGSPAIDAGANSISGLTIPTTDQRGALRGPAGVNAGTHVDIGAYEATSSYQVTSTADSSDVGTLRTAIGWANVNTNVNPANTSNPAPNTIDFNISSGPFTITPTTALPPIIQPVLIDGTSQPGYAGTPIVELNGGGQISEGLVLGNGSGGSTIQGLSIGGFSTAGVEVDSNNNVISANDIGTDAAGDDLGNGNEYGIFITGANNTIGGTLAGSAAANVIGFFQMLGDGGVFLNGTSANGNLVEGNFIGTNAAGSDLGNSNGIDVAGGANNTIGGTSAGASNIIGFNSNAGVLSDTNTGALIEGNFIGTDAAGANLGNDNGVGIFSSNNTIGGTIAGAANTIANNAGLAVDVESGSGNAIRQDLIFANQSAIFERSGANNNQAPPTILAVASVPNLTTIDYSVTGTVGQTYSLDFFASSSLGSPAFVYLGTTTVTLTSTTQKFTAMLNPATALLSTQAVTATVTDSNGNTSPFATTTVTPASPFVVTNTTDNLPGSEIGSLRQAILDANNSPPSSGTDDITFHIPGSAPFAISPTAVLPTIMVPTRISGDSQSGYAGTPIIEINGGGGSLSDGLILGTGSDGSTITALSIGGFSNGYGLDIESSNNLITGNFIGTDAAGDNLANGTGIRAFSGGSNTIGGTTASAANVIGFNSTALLIDSGGNLVEGNLIGTNVAGANLGNDFGVALIDFPNTIGGTVTGAGNTIAYNTSTAVAVEGAGNGNAIRQNLIYGNGGDIVGVGQFTNNNQAAPTIVAVASVPNLTTIDYSVTGTVGQTYFLDVFASNSLGGPAAQFLGTITTPALTTATQSFTATFNLATALQSSQAVTATATDTSGNTSEFAATAMTPASPFVVTNTTDNLPGSEVGSLRQAILDANNSPPASGQTDSITIGLRGAGPYAISLTAVLPTIVVPVTLNGTTLPGSDGTSSIEINGSSSLADGLILGTGSDGSTIEDLIVDGFGSGDGLDIESNNNLISSNVIGTNAAGANLGNVVGIMSSGTNNTIGGTTAAAANVIGFEYEGVLISSADNLVEGNFIGTNASGANLGNEYGIYVSGANNTIGGTLAGSAAANIIGFGNQLPHHNSDINPGVGVYLNGASATDNLVEGNFIGTNAAGSNLGNIDGVYALGDANDTIGGTSAAAANIIAFNSNAGVTLQHDTGILVEGNFIGINAAGAYRANGSGVVIENASQNTIGGTIAGAANTIANNTGPAVNVMSGSGNSIRQNLIFANQSAIFESLGANNNQAAPGIVAVASVPNLTTIDYSVTGSVNGSYTVEFFASSSLGSPASVYLGTTTVTLTSTPQSFTATLNLATALLSSQAVTATVTDSSGDTSPFAATAVTPTSSFVVTNTTDSLPGSAVGSLRQAIMNANNEPPSSGTDLITFAIPGSGPYAINLASSLTIDVPVTINGMSQAGYFPNNRPVVELQGANQAFDGLILGSTSTTSSSGSTIEGLDIAGFGGAGIHIESADDVIAGNFLGTDTTGAAAGPGNGVGILVDNTAGNTIGGIVAAATNVIGFNTSAGVSISGSAATGNRVAGNLIGTDSAGDRLGNTTGIVIDNSASNNTIGGTATGAANTIADNTGDAVHVVSGSGNAIRQNLIFGNSSAIVLESGANNNQAAPSIVAVASVPSLTTIDYSLTGAAGHYTLEFFASSSLGGPASVYLGTTTVTLTSATQKFTAMLNPATALLSSQAVTATVTDSSGDTSPFAATAVTPASPFVVSNTSDNVIGQEVGSLRQAILDANDSQPTFGTDLISFAIPGTGPIAISPTSLLPTITVPVTIDGTSQSGYAGTPIIEINGGGLTGDGLILGAGSSHSSIIGLDIADFMGDGILIESADNTIGGIASSAGNLIGLNSSAGVSISGSGAEGNVVAGNFIGTDASGDNLPNGIGVAIDGIASNNTIGGTLTGVGNTIGSNAQDGVSITFGTGNVVRENTYTGVNGNATQPSAAANDLVLSPNPSNLQATLSAASLVGNQLSVQVQLSGNIGSSSSVTLDIYQYVVDANNNPIQRTFLGTVVASVVGTTASGTIATTAIATATQIVATATVAQGTSAFSAPLLVIPPILVTTTLDNGNNLAPTPGSLRAEIIAANATQGTTIAFDIPNSDPGLISGTYIIDVTVALPAIMVPVTIDGTTEPGFDPKNPAPIVEITNNIPNNGTAQASDGLILGPNSGKSTIKGLDITGFGGGAGIHIESNNDVISGDVLGIDNTGTITSPGNLVGVWIDGSSNNTVGGTTSAAANVIGNNSGAGVSIAGTSAQANLVVGNFIGTNDAGDSLGNDGSGIVISDSSGNTIGGTVAGAGNTIAFNTVSGVSVTGNGNVNIGNGNAILENSIFSNGPSNTPSGILLANGGNDGVTAPTIKGVSSAQGTTTAVTVVLVQAGVPVVPVGSVLEFFASVPGDPLSDENQAQNFLLNYMVTGADFELPNGLKTLGLPTLASNQWVTETVTFPNGDTSEFAKPVQVSNPFSITTTVGSDEGSLPYALSQVNNSSGSYTITFAIPTGTPTQPENYNPTTGIWTITLDSVLPSINYPVFLDAATQPGYAGSPLIVLDGGGLSGNGLTLATGSDGSKIEGLDIVDFAGAGIDLESSDNAVLGNWIGAMSSGPNVYVPGPGNQEGILIGSNSSNNTIGGSAPAAGNVIAFNTNTTPGQSGSGVDVLSSSGDTIRTNLIFSNDQSLVLPDSYNAVYHPPTLTSATSSAGSTAVMGSVSGFAPFTTVIVDFYADAPDQSPARFYLGNDNSVMTDADGKATFTAPLQASVGGGQTIWATATGQGTTAQGTTAASGTSMFSSISIMITSPYVVTTTLDNGNNMTPTPGSLRAVIGTINGKQPSGRQSTLAITFNIPIPTQPDKDYNPTTGVWTINLPSPLPEINVPVTIDGTSQPGYNGTPIIEIDGSMINTSADGLKLSPNAKNSTIEGLDIVGFNGGTNGVGVGIEIQSGGDQIINDNIGVDPTGTTAGPGNEIGILINNAAGNTIGGSVTTGQFLSGVTTNADVIGGNSTGVSISGTSATRNLIADDFIGTNSAGAITLGNGTGIVIADGAQGNTVGGATAVANIIGGNTISGVLISNSTTGTTTRNVIAGNLIGTDAGNDDLGNSEGVVIDDAPGNTIGGTLSSAANTIAFNTMSGVSLSGSSATGNRVAGNDIGTDANGDNLGNGVGISVASANNTIGGLASAAANTIGFNTVAGMSISGATATGNRIVGNFIGTNSAQGTLNLGNTLGVVVSSASNTIGGSANGAANTIADNAGDGIQVNGSSAMGNRISQNRIFSNGGLGIDLVGGANGGIAVPTNLAVVSIPNLTKVDLTISSPGTYTVEFFAGSSLGGPAAVYLGTQQVTTTSANEGRTVSLTLSSALQNPQMLTATVTDSSGDTSEFATAVPPALPFVVTNTTDNQQGSEVGSLRQAINDANADPPKSGTDDITFAIATGSAPFAISPRTALPTITVPVTIDGTSQSGDVATPIIEIDSGGKSFDGLILGSSSTTSSSGSTIEGLEIVNFGGSGIIVETANNTIGGTTQAAANVIGNNTSAGISISGSAATATGNVVKGNFIGTDSAGDNLGNQGAGVDIGGEASGNQIGGIASGAGNVISYNQTDGILIESSGTNNVVLGNDITLNVAGAGSPSSKGKQSNTGNGIEISDGSSDTIGGTRSGAGNLISGNQNDGILIDTTGTNIVVEGNDIGTNAAGTDPWPNNGNGIEILEGTSNVIGGTVSGTVRGARNVISGNQNDGILIETSGNLVEGNYIGTNLGGTKAVPNTGNGGIEISAGSSNNIGGTLGGAGNVISGNQNDGILIDTSNNVVQGNDIGTDYTGTQSLPNDTSFPVNDTDVLPSSGGGVVVVGATGNMIGGDNSVSPGGNITRTAGNLISGNHGSGISITNTGSTMSGNVIEGNFIGTNTSGDRPTGNELPLGNQVGISIGSASNNLIGGTTSAARNLISGNTIIAIQITNSEATGNVVEGNWIGINKQGNGIVLLPNLTTGYPVGILIDDSPGNLIGGTSTGDGNIISGFGVSIDISGFDAVANQIQDNQIGIYGKGKVAIDKDGIGVYIDDVPQNTVAGNTIKGYSTYGVYIYGALATGNVIESNQIGPAAVNGAGIAIEDASSNTVGGSTAADGNTISGNAQAAVYIFGQANAGAKNNVIKHNDFVNNAYGILLYNAANNGGYSELLKNNRYARNGIANVREFTGAVTSSGASPAPTKSHHPKQNHHALRPRSRLHKEGAVRHAVLRLAKGSGLKAGHGEPRHWHELALANRVQPGPAVRTPSVPRAAVPHGPLAHRTSARLLNHPASVRLPADRATGRSGS